MWYYFKKGKTHDLYALLIIILLSIILYFATNISLIKFIAIADIIISTGIFVDLWSHCFHHWANIYLSISLFRKWEKMTEDRVSFGIVINKELKVRLKVYCAKNNVKIKDVIEKALDEYLKEHGF